IEAVAAVTGEAALATTAVSVSAVRSRLGMWGVKAVQARGFGWDQSDHVDRSSGSGSIREAGGAFGKREQAEEDRYFRAFPVSSVD
uniref:ATPase inhibitor, mitochondrial n=1 Tax=Prolemur simus TaxID=1328070 RepID=A0A8C8Z204_PROSS